ncbi:hypothetical protein ACLB2K_038585 [Fragaria x ananassa]
MRLSTRATECARAVALRIKAMTMKRSRSKYASPVKIAPQATSPKKRTSISDATSPKKRKAGSDATSLKKLKAGSKAPSPKKHKGGSKVASPKKHKGGSRASRAASPKKRTSRRLNVTKSVSKSSNNSQQAESDDVAQEEENLTGGLKLLKRGMVTMSQVTSTVIRGQRIVVQLNANGEPIDEVEKQKISESVQEAFVVPKKLRKSVIASAATKWKDFKSSYLNDVLKKSQMTEMVGFVEPNHTGALGCGTPTERSKNLMNCSKNETSDQIYLVPHNSGGIKFYYAQKTKKSSRVSVEWIPLLGIPEQKDGKTCAYLVMRYMKDIIADKDLEFATTWKTKQGIRYTPDQIDEVWAEWAKQVLMFKV